MLQRKNAIRGLVAGLALVMAMLACGPLGSSGGQGGSPLGGGQEPTATPEPLVAVPNLSSVVLTTPTEGAGAKPLFEWEAVTGAASYALVVYDDAGHPYWAWDGDQTSVYLGGSHEPPPAESAGPVLSDGMTWGVMAFQTDGTLIAASERRAISP